MPERKNFVSRCVSIDLEIHPEAEKILKIGALIRRVPVNFTFWGKFNHSEALKELDTFCWNAGFLLGHHANYFDLTHASRKAS